MTAVKLYRAEGDAEGGGGESPPKKKEPPKGYKVTTPQQRRDWNDMLDRMQKDGVSGSKDLDQMDKSVGKDYISKYRKENPNTTVSEDMLPSIQYEHEQLRTGDSFGGMTPEQTRVMRKQFNDAYVSRAIASQGGGFDSTMSRQYYPTFKKGDKDYGTDAESYMKDFAAPSPKTGGGSGKEDVIPYPDYKNQKSRNSYLASWEKKYGNLENRGDTVLKVNEVPRGGSDTAKNISVKAAKEYGLDPALLYSSAMEEGMSGLFKNLDGTDTKHRKPGDFGYQDFYGDKQFPVNGGQNFGFQTFAERFPDLVKAGYLPKEFSKEFRGVKAALGDDAEYADANNFKTVEGAMKAKAALMKYAQDYVKQEAKKNDVELSKNALDFFTLAWFNGGEGGVNRRLVPYAKKGLLKDDKFLTQRPEQEESVKNTKDDVWGHIVPRIHMAKNLKKEKLLEDGDTHEDDK